MSGGLVGQRKPKFDLRRPYAFECPGGKWREAQPDQRICPNCGRAIVIHRVLVGELAEKALQR